MSEGNIFRHFKSKKDIIISIFNDIQDNFIGELRQIAGSNESPTFRLTKYLSATIKYHTDNKGINMLLFSEASYKNDPELKNRLQQIFRDQKQFVMEIISDGIGAGIWDENVVVENVALIYMGIPLAMNMEVLIGGKGFHFDNFCNHMILLLLKMLRK